VNTLHYRMQNYLELLPDDILDKIYKNVSMEMYKEVMKEYTDNKGFCDVSVSNTKFSAGLWLYVYIRREEYYKWQSRGYKFVKITAY